MFLFNKVSELYLIILLLFIFYWLWFLQSKDKKITMSDSQSNSVNGSKNSSDEKPEKFNWTGFKRWQQKMLFYLTTMNLTNIVKEDVPKPDKKPPSKESLMTIEAWKQLAFLCRNYILNRLANHLYDIYSSYKTTNKAWEMLEKKYKTEDARAKKFVIGNFSSIIWLIQKLWWHMLKNFR